MREFDQGARRRVHLSGRHHGQLGMAKDTMAAKPMVLYESDELVALASEEVAIRSVFPHEIDTCDPYDEEVRVWQSVTRHEKAHASHDMGMHTERSPAARQQRFFVTEERSASPIPTPSMSISTSAPRSTAPISTTAQINLQAPRADAAQGYGTIVLKNPGAKHSLAVGILNRLNLHIEGSLRLFRLRPDRRAECAASRAASAGRAARTCWPAPSSSRRMPARSSARRCAAATSSARASVGAPHRHRPEGRHHHRRRRHRRVLRLHDAARPHGDLRRCRQEPRRFHV